MLEVFANVEIIATFASKLFLFPTNRLQFANF